MTLFLGLLQRCVPFRSAARTASLLPPITPRDAFTPSQAPGAPAATARRSVRPLRVVRSIERGSRDARWDGRVVISGGIDEVCAELERLAAIEARMH